jgi:starch-binding outer membrane protein, SusD/RagB family
MTRILFSIRLPLGVALALAACDILDTEPLGTLTDQTFYQTEKDFDAATLASYSTMLNLTYEQNGLGWWNGFLQPDDNVQYRDPNGENDVFNWSATDVDFTWVWATAYKGVMRANVVLDQLPKATKFADPTKKPRYEAEAKFMRAWWYFLLARNWGDVPIVTSVPTSIAATQVGNSQPGEVWDLMESDLEFAAQNLPQNYGSEKGRATSFTALALLGKVELYRAQWRNQPAKYAEAITHLTAAAAGPFTLVPDYRDNFREQTENNSESLFEVQATAGDNINAWGATDLGGAAGHAWTIYVSPSCYYGTGGGCAPRAWGHGYGQIDITPSLASEFEPGDPRGAATMYSTGEDYGGVAYQMRTDTSPPQPVLWSRTGHTPAKYDRPFDPNRFPNNLSTNNLRLIRLADVLLLLAEANLLGNNDVPGAAALVNRVRARARATYRIVNNTTDTTGVLPDVPTTGTPTTWFRTYLAHERRVELALEDSYRYDDLVRWHRAGLITLPNDVAFGFPESNTNWQPRNLLKPVPQRELDVNPNLRQNTGY